MEQVAYLRGDNLTKIDRASMAVSLETRLPILSHEIVELSWRLPLSMKIRDEDTKWALRKVLDKYVPRSLTDRPKVGFSVPINQWLRHDLKEWGSSLLDSVAAASNGLLLEDVVRQCWDDHILGKRDNSHKLWSVLMLLDWMKQQDSS